jgi:hypothetical protein
MYPYLAGTLLSPDSMLLPLVTKLSQRHTSLIDIHTPLALWEGHAIHTPLDV